MLHRLKPYLAAAAILLLLAAITYFQTSGPTRESLPDRREVYGNHIHSGKAILTLEDGRSINLEQAGMGVIGNDPTIRKIGDNALSYSTNTDDLPVAYHTLSTLAGNQYSVTLSDGTRVQLNARSSLRFPISFDSSYRVVELSGEGYFEVAKNTAKPFIVQMPGGASIKVLGTQFNVMVYPEEANQKITLAEGSILVTSASSRRQMKPGEMATIDKGFISTSKADLQKELAWIRNEFLFRNTSLDEICRHLSLWFDVEVVSTANPAERFSASFPKAWPLEKIMGYLEATGKLHFKLDGKKLRVSNGPFK